MHERPNAIRRSISGGITPRDPTSRIVVPSWASPNSNHTRALEVFRSLENFFDLIDTFFETSLFFASVVILRIFRKIAEGLGKCQRIKNFLSCVRRNLY